MKQLFSPGLALPFLISVTLLFQTSVCLAGGSENTIDSMNLSIELANRYLFSNTDSSVKYALRALLLANKTKSEKSAADADYLMAGNYWIMGEYTKALQAALESLHIYERLGDKKNIADVYRAIASIYRDQGDFSNALNYAYKCKELAENIYPEIIYTIIGSIYEKFNRLDSALVYTNKANEKDLAKNFKNSYGYIFLVYGNIYAKQSDYPLALEFYRKGLGLSADQQFLKDQIEIYNGMAGLYEKTGKTDSSTFYAKKALSIGKSTPFLLGMLESSTLLSKIYKSENDINNTVKYMELSAAIKDTLYNQASEREFQNLSFNEQLRQQKVEEERMIAAKNRRHNIQDIGIAAFIPIFFSMMLFLGRRKVDSRIIEFMGILGLLLLFEFISLLLHPYIEKLTNETPVFMVLVLVAIASILVPMHHRLEHWMKGKLVNATHPIGKLQLEKESVENTED